MHLQYQIDLSRTLIENRQFQLTWSHNSQLIYVLYKIILSFENSHEYSCQNSLKKMYWKGRSKSTILLIYVLFDS